MITSLSLIILIVSSQLVIPSVPIPSYFEDIKKQIAQLITNGGKYVNNHDYDPLILATAYQIGNLPVLKLQNISTFKQYCDYADKVNYAVNLLNKKLGIQIPFLKKTQDAYVKLSSKITKYTPLVGQYDDMVTSAKNIHRSDQNSINDFYVKTALFSIMLIIVSTAIYAPLSSDIVMAAFESSGLETMATKCIPCTTYALGEAESAVEGLFVSTTSTSLNGVMTAIASEELSLKTKK